MNAGDDIPKTTRDKSQQRSILQMEIILENTANHYIVMLLGKSPTTALTFHESYSIKD